jgi:hypothetical protein
MQRQFINMFIIHDNKIDMVPNKIPNNLYTIKETRNQNINKDHHTRTYRQWVRNTLSYFFALETCSHKY